MAPYFRGKHRIEGLIEPFARLPPQRRLTTFPDGMVMAIDPASSFERGFYFRSGEPDTYAFLRASLAPGNVFFDCGANVGFFSLVAARLVGPRGRVCAFEPTPATFARLLRNIEVNRSDNVTAFRVALGDSPGTARVIQFSADNHGMNTIAPGVTGGEDVGGCPVRTLDYLIAAGDAPAPHLMKVDVEGSELALLKGAARLLAGPRSPTLIVELSRYTTRRFGYEPEAVVEYLLTLRNYRVEWPFLGRTHVVERGAVLPHYALLGGDHGANYVFRPIP
jgi:FkbM family methyltransferase